jgi:hypothetical protein
MIYWAQLTHFHQPPIQVPSTLKKICNQSCHPFVRVSEEYFQVRVTVNFNGLLTGMAMDSPHKDVINGYGNLDEKRRD